MPAGFYAYPGARLCPDRHVPPVLTCARTATSRLCPDRHVPPVLTCARNFITL